MNKVITPLLKNMLHKLKVQERRGESWETWLIIRDYLWEQDNGGGMVCGGE